MSSGPPAGAARPVLIFDGDCGFCRRAVLRLRAVVGDRVGCVPFQEYEFPEGKTELTPAACAEAVHLVEPDGRVTRAAEACFRAVGHAPGKRWVGALYRFPGLAPVAERVYRFVADHRPAISRAERALSGADPAPPSYLIGRRLFLTLLGAAFVVALWSFGVQAAGLIGSQGILSLDRMIAWDAHAMPYAFLEMPTVFWFAHGDAALTSVIVAGAVAGGLLAVGFWPRLTLFVAWCCWLSLTSLAFPPAGPDYIGNQFLGYSWDKLLVEAGLLALLVAPRGRRPRWAERPSSAGILLLRFLLFRVVFGEVLVRFTSGDPGWREPGALGVHLWTQPLPTWSGVEVHEWGNGVVDALWLAGTVVGLGLAWGLFLPRRLRALAVAAIVISQLGGLITSRLGIWPLGIVALAVLAVDDQTWRRVLPGALARRLRQPEWRAVPGVVQLLRGGTAVVLVLLALHVSVRYFGSSQPSAVQRALQSWQICNGYAPLPWVDPKRFALSIEGSDDGEAWTVLDTRSMPRDAYRPPPRPGLHLRRLDWKLDDVARRVAYGDPPPTWFALLLIRLLEGSPDARALFRDGAFEDAPPRALRVQVHELLPASPADRRSEGMWWYRRPGALVGSPVSLEDGELVPARF